MGRTLDQFVESLGSPFEGELSSIDGFDEAVDLPKLTEVDFTGLGSFDVDELIHFIVLPEGEGEGGRADEKTSVQPEHPGDIGEMIFDPVAARSASLQRTTQLDDEAGATSEFCRFE